ncbi:MAG: sugar transferase [Prevotella sp.]|nr:sugar transferase [Prevotella sp.]MBR4650651.1 sugar transferase [Prevotella sp.]
MYLYIKRFLDIILSLVGIVFVLPIAILVKISFLVMGDTDSIFFRHERIGKDGKPFMMYKFRSMIHNAEEKLEELLKEERYKKEWEESQKLENDPRITRVGRFLRKTSLDEIPQLLNVLKGDMSIVGPRPLVDGELEEHGGDKLYWKVKPGITGWWGSHGRSDVDYKQRLEMEYYYIKNISFKIDMVCIYRTVIAVVSREGAV